MQVSRNAKDEARPKNAARGRLECATLWGEMKGMKRNTENEQINADSSFLIQLFTLCPIYCWEWEQKSLELKWIKRCHISVGWWPGGWETKEKAHCDCNVKDMTMIEGRQKGIVEMKERKQRKRQKKANRTQRTKAEQREWQNAATKHSNQIQQENEWLRHLSSRPTDERVVDSLRFCFRNCVYIIYLTERTWAPPTTTINLILVRLSSSSLHLHKISNN